jgi:exonuclease VII small subunit
MEGESIGGGAQELERITARLEQLAVELEGDVDDERAATLVREASELASQAGRAVEGALRGAPGSPEG